MTQENVAAVLRGQDAFNRRDEAACIALGDPEAENIPPREWLESAPLRGFEAIWDFIVEAQEMVERGPSSGMS
jgi:hypothetical protein